MPRGDLSQAIAAPPSKSAKPKSRRIGIFDAPSREPGNQAYLSNQHGAAGQRRRACTERSRGVLRVANLESRNGSESCRHARILPQRGLSVGGIRRDRGNRGSSNRGRLEAAGGSCHVSGDADEAISPRARESHLGRFHRMSVSPSSPNSTRIEPA